jgi:hypothetical protein
MFERCRYTLMRCKPALAYTAQERTYRDQTLVARDREHGVVAVRATRGRVDEEVDVVVGGGDRWDLGKHDIQLLPLEHLLKRVEGQARKLALNEVRAVLHDGLELDVPVGALPAGDQVQHVDALGGLAVGLASGAGQLDAEEGEDGLLRDRVAHLHKAGVEVDLAEEGADPEEGGVTDAEERRDGFLGTGRRGVSEAEWDREFEMLTKEAWCG